MPDMSIPYADCDFSPMKRHLKEDLEQIAKQLLKSLETFEDENYCMLGQFERIKQKFIGLESRAATFYLNCYLSPFTDKYTELSAAIRNMSKRRHGALIAVERNDPLGPVVHSGMPVGAPVMSSLLESIFYPGGPLHDGAVLVQSNRIVSAKNILPLSNKVQTDEKLGTRHRAAIGLTEQSDAIVLVVSEETGKASFAAKGILYPVISP